jgi:hypothetical protein
MFEARIGKMKITKRQLRRLIREELTRELQQLTEGYMVPEFPNTDSMFMFIEELEPDDEVEQDVIDPESGELMIAAGETPREQAWFEEVAEEIEETPEPDDYEYDWAAEDARLEAEEDAKRAEDERIQDMLAADATTAGEEWAGDTYYDAKNSPDMWANANAETAEDYVMNLGQSAAGDIADSLLQYSMDPDVKKWYASLPEEDDEYGIGWRAGRPNKYIYKDILADYFYDGVSKALEKKKAA